MMRRTSIILVAVTTAVLGGTLIASAQVSSGSPDTAQQNFAKKPTVQIDRQNATDKPVQNDQQNATDKPLQNDELSANRRQRVPKNR